MKDNVSQTTSKILMVRPANFGYNFETASSNSFQANIDKTLAKEIICQDAIKEFDELANKIVAANIDIEIIQDIPYPKNPDAVFPNNWISSHQPGLLVTYPIFAPQRRHERREQIIDDLKAKYDINDRLKFEDYEDDGMFLEGTGSMVFDRVHKVAYACKSIRTHEGLFEQFCKEMGYKPMLFNAVDTKGLSIYHTNVMMNIGEDFAIICLECIPSVSNRKKIVNTLKECGKKIIEISYNQLELFAGNMIQLKNKNGEKYLVMSLSAYNSLNRFQLNEILSLTKIIHSDLTTIETYGGGSAR